ncbi:Peptidoglycan/LPS O-acetylase OafA/YrhL, contains acyltransferase and SGNH-hydrolase domains [Halpernia humi]|uniref:Peptidoglycan/LPS O-acetylase OafA/YrhL, contains acyltransferase and SGNH-hydrolase domains n=1 Tax=Halpernia humi TaxID=493375 RepID=A0A1H5W6P4_9FLAO|nr:acyltransferase [Halpernia humi]SEF94487.1 Peptidoglycan/LPS O-acetylase OafA/YrhL, contains acyltransferase and SGNH-hydrolase domains [Halpernia humi]
MSFTINRNNNFDFLRLILASIVIVSHSYPLTKNDEILAVLTNGQIDFGSLAVNCFFVLSGYFIFLSLQRSKTVTNYIWKRVLRLYPALLGLMVFTFLLIPILYDGNHLTSAIKNYWHYAIGGLSLYNVKYFIPGVFELNPYKGAINGSLWTIAYEFSIYMLLVFLYFFRSRRVSIIILSIGFFLSYWLFQNESTFAYQIFLKINLDAVQLYRLSTYFLAGSLITFLDFKIINSIYSRLGLFLILIVSLVFNFYREIAPFALPLLIILLGILNTKYINSLGAKIGDISYGVYVYGFLVQQIFMNYFNLNPLELMFLSLIITYILAYFSWHFIEEKMMKYKNII